MPEQKVQFLDTPPPTSTDFGRQTGSKQKGEVKTQRDAIPGQDGSRMARLRGCVRPFPKEAGFRCCCLVRV